MVVEAQPLGVEMATALARRGIETHLVDPHPWPMAEIADSDIMAPVEESWRELGVKVHLNTAIEALSGTGKVQAVQTSQGELMANMVVMGTKELPNASLARKAGIKTGATGGIIVDLQIATSAPGVYAAGIASRCPRASRGSRCRGSRAATRTPRERSLAPTPEAAPAPTSPYMSRGTWWAVTG